MRDPMGDHVLQKSEGKVKMKQKERDKKRKVDTVFSKMVSS